MTDYPRYQAAPHCSFEEYYRQHHGAPLVEAALRVADWWLRQPAIGGVLPPAWWLRPNLRRRHDQSI